MKNISLLLLLMIFGFFCGFAQSISVYNIDQSAYPHMKAKIFVLDANGDIAENLTNNDILLTEDGVARPDVTLSCPLPVPPEALSAILTIDVSGSMYGNGIKMAQAAAKVWVEAIPLGKSECAVTSFDSYNYLNCDFTSDRAKLIAAIEKLTPNGGTDFDAGLLNKMFGSLVMAERGKYKRTIVFLTDGYSSGNADAIVKRAGEIDAVIYCVVLGARAPQILKDISQRTGGEYFESITTLAEAEKVYRDILTRAQGGEPCTLEWLSDGCPDNRRVEISVPQMNLSTSQRYSVDFDFLPKMTILPSNSIRFGAVEPGNYAQKKIKFVSGATTIKIDSITNDNSRFRLIDFPSGGLLLEPESDAEFTVEFLPFEANYQFTRFNIFSNACAGSFFYCSGGNSGQGNTLVITEPNGGEVYVAGSDSVITWDGIPDADTVKIEISTDGGFIWKTISAATPGLKYQYTLPGVNSERCLMRIKQLESSGSTQLKFRAHSYYVKSVSLSPDSKYIATCGEDRSFKVFDAATGANICTQNSVYMYMLATYSPDGSKIAVAMSDYSVQILSAVDYSVLRTITGMQSWTDGMCFSSDGTRLALLTGDDSKRRVRIENLNDNTSQYTPTSTEQINRIAASPDGSQLLATTSDGMVTAYDFYTLEEIKTVSVPVPPCNAVAMSPDNSRIAVSASNNATLYILDAKSGQPVANVAVTTGKITDIAWSYNGQSIAVADDNGTLAIYSGEDYSLIYTFSENSFAINDVEWSRDSKYLVAGTNDNYVRVRNFELVIQEAVSEDYFAVRMPDYTVQNADFGRQLIGTVRDSTFSNIITNTGTVPFVLRDYTITGADSAAFSVVSNFPPRDVGAGSGEYIEIQFRPTQAKQYSAVLNVITGFDSKQIALSGTGYESQIISALDFVDFGSVNFDTPKDSLLSLFENASSSEIVIEKIEIIGPDLQQFVVPVPQEGETVSAGGTYVIPLRFAPFERGLTNSVAKIYFSADGSPAVLRMVGEGVSDCGAESFNISNFTSASNVNFVGSAYEKDGVAILNQARQYTSGGVVTKNYIPADSGFTATWSFQITDPYQYVDTETSYPGADGMSFVIHNTTNTNIGVGGGGIAYQAMKNALAIELDLFANDSKQIENYDDPNGNHLAVFKIAEGDTALSSLHNIQNVIALNTDIPIIRSDGTTYYEKVEYNPAQKELTVYIDTTGDFAEPLLVVSDFLLSKYIDMEYDKGVFLSINAASGSSYQSHKLLSFRTCSYTTATSIVSGVYDEFPADFTAEIRPMPFKNDGVIVLNNAFGGECRVEFFDEAGQEILSEIVRLVEAGKSEISLPSGLPRGTNFVKISLGGNAKLLKAVKL